MPNRWGGWNQIVFSPPDISTIVLQQRATPIHLFFSPFRFLTPCGTRTLRVECACPTGTRKTFWTNSRHWRASIDGPSTLPQKPCNLTTKGSHQGAKFRDGCGPTPSPPTPSRGKLGAVFAAVGGRPHSRGACRPLGQGDPYSGTPLPPRPSKCTLGGGGLRTARTQIPLFGPQARCFIHFGCVQPSLSREHQNMGPRGSMGLP